MSKIFLRFPGGRTKSLTLSYDDGVEQDIRLVQILNTYGLKGTFNLNSGLYAKEGTVYRKGDVHRRMTEKQVTQTFMNSVHEVAVHSLTHPFLEQLPDSMIVGEIIKDRENLEKQFGTIVRGMAYPYGTMNDNVISVIRNCGIVYGRTIISTNDFRIPDHWMKLTATCHHKSPELQNLTKKFVEDKVTRAPYLFFLWGHSYEFDADNNWYVIEEFAKYAGNREEVWYATNIEIYDYIEAYKHLIFSVDGKRVKNPSPIKVWFEHAGDIIEIEAGSMIEL
ncbi:MAG: Polysaccharide deacetylase [Firmicutes bacterium ADurb.Bin419]|nr:MAG: Polysaccharide deacetylase [Firmicutes bacterium ADurb.Bin419]